MSHYSRRFAAAECLRVLNKNMPTADKMVRVEVAEAFSVVRVGERDSRSAAVSLVTNDATVEVIHTVSQ